MGRQERSPSRRVLTGYIELPILLDSAVVFGVHAYVSQYRCVPVPKTNPNLTRSRTVHTGPGTHRYEDT